MFRLRFLLLALLVAPHLQAEDFTTRAHSYLQRIADRQQPPDFACITAQLVTGGRTEIEGARRQLDSLLRHPTGDMFYMYASMGCLYSVRDMLPQMVRDQFRNVWKTYTFYRGDTENHFLMYYAGLLLATQEWPGLAGSEWFNGKASDENAHEAREYLMQWIDTVARTGLVEFDSPRYFYYQITPLILLHDFSRDSIIKVRAELMLDYLFADFAVDYLHGSYTGAHSRDGESSSIEPNTAEAISYAGLYFGDVDVERPLQDLAFAALSRYRLPEIIRELAFSSNIVHRESRRARTHIRFGGEPEPVVLKYNFKTSDFALGSLEGTVVQPIQQRSWSLIFNSAFLQNKTHQQNAVFALHPTHSARELGTFFPEELGLLVGDIGKSKTGYASEDKWIGGSFSERIRQEKNVLVALYDIPDDDPVNHIDYFIPTDLDSIERDTSGWIFLKVGRSYGGIYPLRPCDWITDGSHVRLRSSSRRNGYVVVAGSNRLRPQIKNYEAFKTELRKATIDTSEFATKCAVTVHVGNRAAWRAAYSDPPQADSSLFSDSEFSYLRSGRSTAPHISSERGSGIIEISRPGEALVLDFVRNTKRHALPTLESK